MQFDLTTVKFKQVQANTELIFIKLKKNSFLKKLEKEDERQLHRLKVSHLLQRSPLALVLSNTNALLCDENDCQPVLGRQLTASDKITVNRYIWLRFDESFRPRNKMASTTDMIETIDQKQIRY